MSAAGGGLLTDGLVRPESPEVLEEAAAHLRGGRLVAFPTETVYGVGADASNAEAVARIFAAKGRPRFNPLIAHVESVEAAERVGVFGPDARVLAAAFWPGPLTLVVPRREGARIVDLATAGLPTVGIRVPGYRLARTLVEAVGRPIVAPSANRSGHVTATTARHVAEDLGTRVALVIDGGPTPVGLESTILGLAEDEVLLLRPGGVPREAIERVLGRALTLPPPVGNRPLASGMLASHYAPHAAVRLDATEVAPGEAVIGFGPGLPRGAEQAAAVENLSPTGDLAEAANRLFAVLRALDAAGVDTIAVAPIPAEGLGEAIRDRLARAAAPRPPEA